MKYLMPAGVNCRMKAILSLAAHALLQLMCSKIFLATLIQRRKGQGLRRFLLIAAVLPSGGGSFGLFPGLSLVAI